MEFALTLPILLFVTMAIFDFGRALFTYAEASNRLRTALRYGAILGYASDSPNYARCQDMIDIANRITFDSATTMIDVTYRRGDLASAPAITWDDDNDPSTGNVSMTCTSTGTVVPMNTIVAATGNGDIISISVTAQVRTITPVFPPNLPIVLQGQRTLVKEIVLKSCGDGVLDPASENCRNCIEDWEADNGAPLDPSIESPACIAGPLNFTGTPTSPVVLSWNSIPAIDSEADSIQIQRRTVGGVWGTITFPELAATAVSYSDSGVSSGNTYEYRIRYFRDNPVAEYSDWTETTVTVGGSGPCTGVDVGDTGDEPANFTGVGGPTAQVVLTWDDTTCDEEGFQIQRATGTLGPGPFSNITTSPASTDAETATDTGVSCGGIYWYQIRSFETQGQDSESSWVQIGPITVTCGTPPSNPTVVATAISDTEINVSWSPYSGCPSCTFEIERNDVGATNWPGTALTLTPDNQAQTYADTGLQCSKTYYYRVRAANGGLYSSWVTASATTQNGSCGVRPNAPTNLSLSGRTSGQNASPTDKYIQIQWTDNANNETGYNIYRATRTSGVCGTYSLLTTYTGFNNVPQANQNFTASTGTNVIYQDYTVTLGQSYCYQVFSYISSTSMESSSSLTGNATTHPVPTMTISCDSQGQDNWHVINWTNNSATTANVWALWADRTGSGFTPIDFKLIFQTSAYMGCGSRRVTDTNPPHCFNGNQSFWVDAVPYQFYLIATYTSAFGTDIATSAINPSGGAGTLCN